MWPYVNFVVWAKCIVRVGICYWPKDVLLVVSHALEILEN